MKRIAPAITIIRYRSPGPDGGRLIALSQDTGRIEQAIAKAKDRIAVQGLAAYKRREHEEHEGIPHDPGTAIAGFPNWADVYREELATVGIAAVVGSNTLCYETQPFEKLDRGLPRASAEGKRKIRREDLLTHLKNVESMIREDIRNGGPRCLGTALIPVTTRIRHEETRS